MHFKSSRPIPGELYHVESNDGEINFFSRIEEYGFWISNKNQPIVMYLKTIIPFDKTPNYKYYKIWWKNKILLIEQRYNKLILTCGKSE